MKRILLLILTISIFSILVGCGTDNSAATDLSGNTDKKDSDSKDETYTIEKTEYSLNDVKLIGEIGKNPDDFKLSFLKSDKNDGVIAYGMCYSSAEVKKVDEYLKGMTYEQLKMLEGEEKLYIITNLEYADGVGNTYNEGQHDIINDGVMDTPGEYRFYAFTIGNDGMLGLAEADRKIIISPYAKNLIFSRQDNNLDITFDSYNDDTIDYNLFFISTKNIDEINMRIGMLTKGEVSKLSEGSKAIKCDNDENIKLKVCLDDIKDIYGEEYRADDVYYAFIATVGKSGKILGISKSPAMIFPDKLLDEAKDFNTGEGNGLVFPNGGATDSVSLSKDVLGYLKTKIGGRPRVAVFLAASGNESSNYSEFSDYQSMFKQVGMDAIYIPVNTDNFRYVSNEKYLISLIKSCHGIYFGGGNQAKLSRITHNDDGTLNEIGKAIIDTVKKGGFAIGTSAGCNIMSDPTYLDNESNNVISKNKTEFLSIGAYDSILPSVDTSVATEGLNLVEQVSGVNVLMDSHFDARSRLGRMLVAMRDNNITLGIGCDEATGISISKGLGTVYGSNAVFIVDTRNAVFSSPDDEKFTVSGVKLSYLTVGDQYNFINDMVMPRNKKKAEIIQNDWTTDDVFNYNGYNTTKALVTTSYSNEESKEFSIRDCGQKLVLVKNNDTRIYQGDRFFNLQDLKDYPVCTIENIELQIK